VSTWEHARQIAQTKRDAENEARGEDLAWMIETGECLSGAAVRLGITVDALEKWMQRREMYDDLATLHSREPFYDEIRATAARRSA
jgi:hypothetical protein